MKHRRQHFPLTTWFAVAALCLLLAAPATAVIAAPADAAPSGTLLGWATDWWSELTAEWAAVIAGSETVPSAAPDGFSTEPLPEGELSTTQNPEGGGEAFPSADPNG